MESVLRITVFGVIMTVKSSLEFFVLTSFHAGMVEFLIYCVRQKLYHNLFLLVSFLLTNSMEKLKTQTNVKIQCTVQDSLSFGTYFCILHNRSHINIDLLCKVAWTPSLTSSIKCSHIDWKADKWNNTCWQLGVISYRDLDSNHQLLRHFLK